MESEDTKFESLAVRVDQALSQVIDLIGQVIRVTRARDYKHHPRENCGTVSRLPRFVRLSRAWGDVAGRLRLPGCAPPTYLSTPR